MPLASHTVAIIKFTVAVHSFIVDWKNRERSVRSSGVGMETKTKVIASFQHREATALISIIQQTEPCRN